MSVSQKINEARKALAALLLPALIVLASALLAGSDGGSSVSLSEWVTALAAALGTSGTVYTVKNAASSDPTTSTPGPGLPDAGAEHLDPAGSADLHVRGARSVAPRDALYTNLSAGDLGNASPRTRDGGFVSLGLVVTVVVVVLAVLFVVNLARGA